MQYTPQQQMGFAAYSLPARVGNWAEDEYITALHTKEHKEKAQVGTLTSSVLSASLGVAASPAELAQAHEDGIVRFGDVVALTSPLGGLVASNTRNRVEISQEAYAVSRTPSGDVTQRCTWVITPIGAPPADGLLRFGMPFQLASTAAEPLYLQGMRFTIANQGFSNSIRGAVRKEGVFLVYEPSYATQWKAVPLNPTEEAQYRLDGQPVPANTFVALQHCQTLINLCTDSHTQRFDHGVEYSVSLYTDADVTKSEWGVRTSKGLGESNHFAFSSGA